MQLSETHQQEPNSGVPSVRHEDKRNFMRRKLVARDVQRDLEHKNDPLEKREQFAISLRKKKKEEILRQKRSRLANSSG